MTRAEEIVASGCPYCAAKITLEDAELFANKGFYTCPKCTREGCGDCMPSGRRCLCPECEGELD